MRDGSAHHDAPRTVPATWPSYKNYEEVNSEARRSQCEGWRGAWRKLLACTGWKPVPRGMANLAMLQM
jgi:hypothetical protein